MENTKNERQNKLIVYLDEAVAYLKESLKTNDKLAFCDADRIISLAEQIKQLKEAN